jgi:hypothetical protein
MPHIGLDYVFEVPNGQKFQLPYGQYFMFSSSLLASFYLFRSTRFDSVLNLFSNKTLLAGMALIMLGIGLASTSVWGWRLLAIVGMLAVFVIIAANFVMNADARTQTLALLLLVLPFSVPVFGSVLLEFLGPVDIGVLISNIKHMSYSPQRWHFMNMSANGFGFDAALVSLFFSLSIFHTKNTIWKLILVALLALSLYALLKSGTRAAFVFYFAAFLAFAILRYGVRALLFLFFGILFVSALILISDSLDTVISFLRLEGNLDKISSTRWIGIVGMWELFVASPFQGLGFGSADNQFPVRPSNIFYFGLLAEIGLAGFLGALIILAYPAKYVVSYLFKPVFPQDAPFLFMFSASVLAGFVPYLMVEFDVLRVSVNHQLFFFCWGVVMFYSIKAGANSSHKNET